MKGYIYKHTSPTGKSYIGQTFLVNPEKRWRNGKGYCSQSGIGSAIKRYGWDNFTHEIIEVLEADTKLELISLLNHREEFYIVKFNTLVPNGYNLTTRGRNHIFSEETKRKIHDRFEKSGAYVKPKSFNCSICGKEVVSSDKNLARARKRFSGRVLCKSCKAKATYRSRTGFESPLQDPKVLLHKTETMITRYGVTNFGQIWTDDRRASIEGKNNPMYGKRGGLHPNAKAVVNSTTGEVFDCLLSAAKAVNGSRSRLRISIDSGKPYHNCIFNWKDV